MRKTLTTYIIFLIFSSVTYGQEACCFGIKCYFKDSLGSIIKKNQYLNYDYQIYISIGTLDLWHAPTVEFDTLTNIISAHLCYNIPVCIDPKLMVIHKTDTMIIELETSNGLILDGYNLQLDTSAFNYTFKKGNYYGASQFPGGKKGEFLLEKRNVTQEEFEALLPKKGKWTEKEELIYWMYFRQRNISPKWSDLKWAQIEIK